VEARQYYQTVIDLHPDQIANPRFIKGYKGKKLIDIARTNIDKVPQIALATAEDVNRRDTDHDGVPDNLDRCPNTPTEATVSINGCWALINIFSSGEAIIRSQFYDQLNAVVRILSQDPSLRIEIQGHTDDTGPADLNKRLSEKRAQAVMLYLIRKGINAKRLRWVGYGHTRPIATNNTAEGREHNRRIELRPI
jgi:OOP family OmpA-OmpF porin